jgi:hypothetical protein
MIRRWRVRGTGLAALMCLAVGCNSSDRLVKVDGKVTLEGEPVGSAMVTFSPTTTGRMANGITGPDGTFHLTTHEEGDGIMPGHYKVTVQPGPSRGNSPPVDPTDPNKAMGKAMANAGKGRGDKPAAKSGIPEGYADLRSTDLEVDIPPKGTILLTLRKDLPPPPKIEEPPGGPPGREGMRGGPPGMGVPSLRGGKADKGSRAAPQPKEDKAKKDAPAPTKPADKDSNPKKEPSDG